MTSNMALAHPHATGVAVYPAMFEEISKPKCITTPTFAMQSTQMPGTNTSALFEVNFFSTLKTNVRGGYFFAVIENE